MGSDTALYVVDELINDLSPKLLLLACRDQALFTLEVGSCRQLRICSGTSNATSETSTIINVLTSFRVIRLRVCPIEGLS